MTTLLPRPRRRRQPAKAPMNRRRKIAIITGSLVVLAGCGYGGQSLLSLIASTRATCSNSGATVVLHEGAAGECVGITDGSFQFIPSNPRLVRVLDLIKSEDDWVGRQKRDGASYVSVGYLMSISTTGGGVEPVSTVIEQLEGAYTAQYYANHHDLTGAGSQPYIKLLVASSGTQADEWPTAVREIEQAKGSQRLVAVAGIGVSLDSTAAEVTSLTKAGIPVIGSSLTGDSFSNIPNMVRVSPSNSADVSAILSFIRNKYPTAFLIEDTNTTDTYVTSLGDGFTAGIPAKRIADQRDYNSAVAVDSVDGDTLPDMATPICASGARVVLFAGRSRDLAALLDGLSSRPCPGRPIAVVTGADVINLSYSPGGRNPDEQSLDIQQGLKSGVSLYYTGEASPDEWDNATGTAGSRSREAYSNFTSTFTKLFPPSAEDDGNAMMAWDALYVAATAARLGNGTAGATTGGTANALGELQGPSTVYGASGPISFTGIYGQGHEGSDPDDKPVPILQVMLDGQIKFVQFETPTTG
jgi:hypothetical protein